jgi:hypothetical protein
LWIFCKVFVKKALVLGRPTRYSSAMGRTIRRTVTITITETWTIVWTTDETSPRQGTTVVQEQPKSPEEPDETILPAITPGAATDAQPDDGTAKPKAVYQTQTHPSSPCDRIINEVRETKSRKKGESPWVRT